MNEMIERVVQALYDNLEDQLADSVDLLAMQDGRIIIQDLDGQVAFDARSAVKAIIAAMREPTEAMQVAGHQKRHDPLYGTDEVWADMIDEALK